jgi:hypothetical protein
VLACNLIVQSGGNLLTTHCLLASNGSGELGQLVGDIEKKVTSTRWLRGETDLIEDDPSKRGLWDREGDWWSWWLSCKFVQIPLPACVDVIVNVYIEARPV